MAKNRAEFLFNEEGEDDGDVELELRMEYQGATRHRTSGASPFDPDERPEGSSHAKDLGNGPNGNRKTIWPTGNTSTMFSKAMGTGRLTTPSRSPTSTAPSLHLSQQRPFWHLSRNG
jgi:hypothetical protein